MHRVHIPLQSHCSSSHLHIHILCSYLEHILKAPFDAFLHTFHKVDIFQIQKWQKNSLLEYIQCNESEYQGLLLLHIPQRNRVLHHIQGMTASIALAWTIDNSDGFIWTTFTLQSNCTLDE